MGTIACSGSSIIKFCRACLTFMNVISQSFPSFPILWGLPHDYREKIHLQESFFLQLWDSWTSISHVLDQSAFFFPSIRCHVLYMKDGLSDTVLQETLDYAYAAGADCRPILKNGPCYQPNTVQAHCDYAVNSYFQRNRQAAGTCDFGGTAMITSTAPGNPWKISAQFLKSFQVLSMGYFNEKLYLLVAGLKTGCDYPSLHFSTCHLISGEIFERQSLSYFLSTAKSFALLPRGIEFLQKIDLS